MTTSQARGIKQEGINDASVAEYLQTYPDFFERNSPLLAKLRLPHVRDVGATVSLVERQVEVLRERNQSLERKLKELVDVARANDTLADRIHRLSQRLIRAHTLLDTINAVETSLREDFDPMHSVLVLFLEQAHSLAPQAGQAHRDFPFGKDSVAIGSVALTPLGPKGELGILAIGASDAERFHPAMSTEFLSRIGELVTYALMRS